MQNKQNSSYISFLKNRQRRISEWKQIRIAYRLVRLTYRMVRSKKQDLKQNIERNLKHLKKIFETLKLLPINPYYYWVDRQLTHNTAGMKFHTIWY